MKGSGSIGCTDNAIKRVAQMASAGGEGRFTLVLSTVPLLVRPVCPSVRHDRFPFYELSLGKLDIIKRKIGIKGKEKLDGVTFGLSGVSL